MHRNTSEDGVKRHDVKITIVIKEIMFSLKFVGQFTRSVVNVHSFLPYFIV